LPCDRRSLNGVWKDVWCARDRVRVLIEVPHPLLRERYDVCNMLSAPAWDVSVPPRGAPNVGGRPGTNLPLRSKGVMSPFPLSGRIAPRPNAAPAVFSIEYSVLCSELVRPDFGAVLHNLANLTSNNRHLDRRTAHATSYPRMVVLELYSGMVKYDASRYCCVHRAPAGLSGL